MKKLLFYILILLASLLFTACTPTTYSKEFKAQVESDCKVLIESYLEKNVSGAKLGTLEMVTGTENGRIATCGTNIAKGTFTVNDSAYLIAADRETGEVYTNYGFTEFFPSLSEEFTALPGVKEILGDVIFYSADLQWHFTSTGVEGATSDVYSYISGMVPAKWTTQDLCKFYTNTMDNDSATSLPATLLGFSAVYAVDGHATGFDEAAKEFLATYPALSTVTFTNVSDRDFALVKETHNLQSGYQLGEKELFRYELSSKSASSQNASESPELFVTYYENDVIEAGAACLRYVRRAKTTNLTKNEVVSDQEFSAEMTLDGQSYKIKKPEKSSSYFYFTENLCKRCKVSYVRDDQTTGDFGTYSVVRFPNGLYSPIENESQAKSGLYINSFDHVITILE